MKKYITIKIKNKDGIYNTKKLLYLTSYDDFINQNIFWMILMDENDKSKIILPFNTNKI
jgi:hypothetical protein